jgi:hypothetical protein
LLFVPQAPDPEEKKKKMKNENATYATQSKLLTNEQGRPQTAPHTQDGITTKKKPNQEKRKVTQKRIASNRVTRSVVVPSTPKG